MSYYYIRVHCASKKQLRSVQSDVREIASCGCYDYGSVFISKEAFGKDEANSHAESLASLGYDATLVSTDDPYLRNLFLSGRSVSSALPDPAPVRCPCCGSTQIQAVKKGFSFGKAAMGVALFGQIGSSAGLIGAEKTDRVCLNCGKKF